MRDWLRRLAMRYLDLNTGEYCRSIEKRNAKLAKDLSYAQVSLGTVYSDNDALRESLERCHNECWKPALRDALRKANG